MKIAIAGCSHIHTPAYVRWLAAHPEVEIIAVADRTGSTASAIATELGAPVTTIDEVWSLPHLDAVLILPETVHHRDDIARAVAAGLSVFVEKPLAMNGPEAAAIARDVSAAAVPFQIGFFMRQMPALRELRSLVAKGVLGEITRARVSVAHDAALKHWFDAYPWMIDREQAGFGGFGDMAVHGIDLMLWFFGQEIEAVTAATGRLDAADGDSDHFGEGIIRFRSGPIATVVSSWVDGGNPVLFEVRGTRGVAHVQGNDLVTWGVEVPPVASRPVDPGDALAAFIDACRTGNSSNLVSITDASLSTRVADTMYRAAREGRWLAVD